MVISFPKELTEDEERLLKKMAKLKKKKKQLIDLRASKEQKNAESIALKRKSNDAPSSATSVKDDAKETAKKLVKSGLIKLENENKEKGFKRSLSRRDEKKPTNLNLDTDTSMFGGYSYNYSYGSPTPTSRSPHQTPPAPQSSSYKSISSPIGAGGSASAAVSTSSSSSSTSNQQQYSQQRNRFNFNRMNTYKSQYSNNNNGGGLSLHVKGNIAITEEYLKNVFATNLNDVNIVSIDMKKGYAFVAIDKKESAELAINTLNSKTFNDIQLSVSYARPRRSSFDNKQYNTNTSAHHVSGGNSSNDESAMQNWTEITQAPAAYSSTAQRTMVSYEDGQDLFN